MIYDFRSMEKIIISGYLLLLLALSSHCQPSPTKSTTLETLAANKIGKGYAIKRNQSNTYALCYEAATTVQHISKKSRFIVVKIATLQVVVEDVFVNGRVQWKNDTEVEYATSNPSGKAMAEPQLKTISITPKEM